MSSLLHQLAPEAGHDAVTAARVEELYTTHVALVRSVCRSLLRDRIEAEDAVQQTFLSAQRALLNGSSPRDAAAWLATIARHESLARVRARMRDPLPVDTEVEAGGPDAYAVAVTRQDVGELRDALAELPAQQRDAILMRELRGLSYEEVASELSITPTAVRSLLFRARQSLQVRLRGALASFSPGFAFRDLLARAGGGVAGPAAAKTLAVGVGAAVITGGALVGPRVIRFGDAPSTHRAAPARSGIQSRASVTSERPSRLFAAPSATPPKPRSARTQGGRHGGASTDGGSSTSDGRGDPASTAGGTDSGSPDRFASDSGDTGTTSSGSGDTSTTSDVGSGSNDASQSSGGTQTTSSGSGETSTTSDGGSSGSSGGSSSGSGDGQPSGAGIDG
jgi:RNA polymerase sigma-70 factor, ECF subfamily